MIIRKAQLTELDKIMEIYASARLFMAENGNSSQWGSIYPPYSLVESGIDKTYVCVEGDDIACVFYYAQENDPTYKVIYDGQWVNSAPYGVVHRIASSHVVKGAAKFCLNWAFSQCNNLRIDTHRDNIPMQNLLTGLNFQYCGIIHLDSGDERLAFQKTK